MNKYKNSLEERGIKPTYIRMRILNYICDNKIHPTAEAIYESLKNEIPTISKTSVYNTLNTFCEKKLACPVIITGSEIRYDSDTSPHHHFFCVKCGRIIDLSISCSYFQKGTIFGHRVKELHGFFRGVCKDCDNARKDK